MSGLTDEEREEVCEATGGPMCPGCPYTFGGCGARLIREESEHSAT